MEVVNHCITEFCCEFVYGFNILAFSFVFNSIIYFLSLLFYFAYDMYFSQAFVSF